MAWGMVRVMRKANIRKVMRDGRPVGEVRGRETVAQQRAQAWTAGPAVPTNDRLWSDREGLYTILRNEPTVLADDFLFITTIVNYLCRLQGRFAGGFVLENEATGGVFLRGVH